MAFFGYFVLVHHGEIFQKNSAPGRRDWIDTCLMGLGISPVIPSKSNEDRKARQVSFSSESYRKRNIIERVIGWIKENRRVFSRFEKTAKNFGGMIKMAFIRS